MNGTAAQRQVMFLEEPRIGGRARILLNGQSATTSHVKSLGTDPAHPEWFWIETESGNRYHGQVQSNRTVYGSPPQATQFNASPPAPSFPIQLGYNSPGAWYPPGLNWGAFLLAPWWGIAHNVWIALLALLPGASLVVEVALLIKGNEWGWQNRQFADVGQFYAVQRAWLIAGIIVAVVSFPLMILAWFFFFGVLAAIGA